ncbi:MAG: hypothetical protein ACK58T_20235, partial [Phycisphaerae bacterium]
MLWVAGSETTQARQTDRAAPKAAEAEEAPRRSLGSSGTIDIEPRSCVTRVPHPRLPRRLVSLGVSSLDVRHPSSNPVLLSLSISGLPIPDARERLTSAAEAAARAEIPALHLDATLPGIRPRELDRSARRDLLAIVKRHNVSLTGCDLFIPPTHFNSPQHQQRAADAVRQAIAFAAELRSLGALAAMVCIETDAPVAKQPDAAFDATPLLTDLATHARDHGVTLCDCTSDTSPLARGLDIAAILARNEDPAAAILTH